jgi:hypothetical protein
MGRLLVLLVRLDRAVIAGRVVEKLINDSEKNELLLRIRKTH